MTDSNSQAEPQDETAQQLSEQAQALGQEAAKVAEGVQLNLSKMYKDNPYAMIGLAFGVGYLLGGGLFTPFSLRVGRVGTFAVPLLAALNNPAAKK